jgi:hypothetical protein
MRNKGVIILDRLTLDDPDVYDRLIRMGIREDSPFMDKVREELFRRDTFGEDTISVAAHTAFQGDVKAAQD